VTDRGRTWIVTIDEPIFYGRLYKRLIEAATEEISGVIVLPPPSEATARAWFTEALYRLRFWGAYGSIFAAWQLLRARVLGTGDAIGAAKKAGIPAFRETSLANAVDRLRRARVNTVLASVSSRVPPEGLNAAQTGWINTHCGPLPRYGGLDAPFWCLYHREPEVTVSLHYMSENIDDGPILAQRSIPAGTRTYFSLVFELFDTAYSMHLGFLKESWPDPDGLERQETTSRTYFSKPPAEAGRDFRRRGGRFA